jgi:hypothetical protein
MHAVHVMSTPALSRSLAMSECLQPAVALGIVSLAAQHCDSSVCIDRISASHCGIRASALQGQSAHFAVLHHFRAATVDTHSTRPHTSRSHCPCTHLSTASRRRSGRMHASELPLVASHWPLLFAAMSVSRLHSKCSQANQARAAWCVGMSDARKTACTSTCSNAPLLGAFRVPSASSM